MAYWLLQEEQGSFMGLTPPITQLILKMLLISLGQV